MQIHALAIALRSETADRVEETKLRDKHLDSLFEAWLAFEHPDAYKELERRKREEDSVEISEIEESDMLPLIAKMKRLAAMERDKARG